jgi:sugar fermentation stimulation protein A
MTTARSVTPHVHVPLGGGGTIVEAIFLARPNRFLVEAELDGHVVQAHLADRGRLKETLVPNARLLLAHRPAPGRKTAYQAVAAVQDGMLTSLDTHLPNRLIEAALRASALEPFAGYSLVRREVTVGGSRFDFQLSDGARRCTLEVKSAGYVENGIATFPDAPTTRGRRHLLELAGIAAMSERAAVLFVAQGAARAIAMNRAIDPDFADTLRAVAAAGIEVHGYACPLTCAGISLGVALPVLFD